MCYSFQSWLVCGYATVVPLVAQEEDISTNLALLHITYALNKVVRVELESWWFHASTLFPSNDRVAGANVAGATKTHSPCWMEATLMLFARQGCAFFISNSATQPRLDLDGKDFLEQIFPSCVQRP